MISDKDIVKLKKEFAPIFAGKKEFLELKADVTDLKVEVGIVKTDVAELKLDMADVKHDIHRVLVSVDKIAAGFDELKIETAAYNQILFRHDRQIHELATKTHVTLSTQND